MGNPELETTLKNYRGWLHKTASEYARDRETINDLAQEGYIAMWQAYESYVPGSSFTLSTHLMNKARWRMALVAHRESYTGMPSRKGKHDTAHTASTKGRELAVDFSVLREFDYAAPDSMDRAMVAYHRKEIMAAINTLTPTQRRHVFNRFWLDITDRKQTSWWSRENGVRDRLWPQLEHLQDLVR